MDASPPVVLYDSPRELRRVSDLQDKCPGVRIFYFNEGDQHRDHSHQRREWNSQPDDDQSLPRLEAGTVIALLEYSSRGELKPVVVVRWDCGREKAYTELEWSCLRVFDLGPAGVCT